MLLNEESEVLILDEVTSNIDEESADKIMSRIVKENKDKIIFILSHYEKMNVYTIKTLNF